MAYRHCSQGLGAAFYRRLQRKPPADTIECETCDGDGVVGGDCTCGRCESPPDVRCPTCGGAGYVDAPEPDPEPEDEETEI